MFYLVISINCSFWEVFVFTTVLIHSDATLRSSLYLAILWPYEVGTGITIFVSLIFRWENICRWFFFFCEDKLLQSANIQLYILAPEVWILVLVILSISKPWLYIKCLALVVFGYLNILFSQSHDKLASISLQYPPITSSLHT